nr:hypothetical protein [Bradyrhizobium sediminis]
MSPSLNRSGAPTRAPSFVVLCDDPDAPAGTWHHWVGSDAQGKRLLVIDKDIFEHGGDRSFAHTHR